MQTILKSLSAVVLLAIAVSFGGCDTRPAKVSPPDANEHDHDHDHAGHADEHQGPHGGDVIELGRNHQYHAELVENVTAGTVTVYLLDKDLKELPIEAPKVTMDLKYDGQAKSFELPAVAAAGKTSQFESADKSLLEAIHEYQATGKLNVTIDGVPYSGEVEHHHHDGEHQH